MPAIQLDFSEIPSNEPVPAGNYLFVVENVDLRTSKNIDEDTNEPSKYLNWDLVITEGPFAGRHLWTITSLKRKALWKLRTVLINLGAFDENLNLEIDEDTNQVLEPELIGLVGVAVVKMGTNDKGAPRSEVDTILDIDGVDREKAMRSESKAAKNGKAPGQQERLLTKEEALEGAATGATVPLDRSQRKMTLR